MLEFWDSGHHAAAGPMPIWEVCAATWGHSGICPQASANAHVVSMVLLRLEWSYCSWSCLYVCYPCYYRVLYDPDVEPCVEI